MVNFSLILGNICATRSRHRLSRIQLSCYYERSRRAFFRIYARKIYRFVAAIYPIPATKFRRQFHAWSTRQTANTIATRRAIRTAAVTRRCRAAWQISSDAFINYQALPDQVNRFTRTGKLYSSCMRKITARPLLPCLLCLLCLSLASLDITNALRTLDVMVVSSYRSTRITADQHHQPCISPCQKECTVLTFSSGLGGRAKHYLEAEPANNAVETKYVQKEQLEEDTVTVGG